MPRPSRAPPHPGSLLRDRVLPDLSLSVTQASRELGVCRQTLHRLLAGKAAVTLDMAVRIARLTGVPARFWLELQQAYDLARAEMDLAELLARMPAYVLPPAIANELTTNGG